MKKELRILAKNPKGKIHFDSFKTTLKNTKLEISQDFGFKNLLQPWQPTENWDTRMDDQRKYHPDPERS